jgi:enterochelin esterase family protein
MHPVLQELVDGLVGIDDLRATLGLSGGPLRHHTDDGRVELTFVWIGDAPSVSLQCGLAHPATSVAMEQRPGLPVWTAVLTADADTLVSYRFVVDDPYVDAGQLDEQRWQELMMVVAQRRSYADPFNRHHIAPLATLFGLPVVQEQYESVLALHHAPPTPWFAPHEAAPGELHRFELTSPELGNTRDITVWTPPELHDDHPLVVLLDGPSFLRLGELDRALDLAVERREFKAPVVAFVHEAHGTTGLAERTHELSCNPAHAVMLTDELIPELRHRFPVSRHNTATVLGGASLGGLASAYTAMRRPDVVGNVLSVSGSYWFGIERDGHAEWLTRRLHHRPVPGLRWYQQIGRYEDGPLAVAPTVTHLQANRHLHDLLVAQGVDVVYEEMGTAHDVCAFRVAVMHGLRALLRH